MGTTRLLHLEVDRRTIDVAVGELDASLGAVQRQPPGTTPQTNAEHEPDISAIAVDE